MARRALVAGAVLVALGVGFAGGWFAHGSSQPRPPALAVMHESHPKVPHTVSASCPVVNGTITVSPASGPPGTIVTVSGPIYYLNKAGRVSISNPNDYEVWWNLLSPHNSTSWNQVGVDAMRVARGLPPQGSDAGAQMLGDYFPNGACSFHAQFRVPDVSAGSYPLSVMNAGSGGFTLFGYSSKAFQVTPSSSLLGAESTMPKRSHRTVTRAAS